MVIFCCGVVTGALVMKTGLRRPFAPREPGVPMRAGSPGQFQNLNFLRRMDGQLGLSTNQHDRIEKIMRASQDRTMPLWDLIAPEMQKELTRVREEIHQELTPAQQKEFAEMLQARRRAEGLAPRDGEQFRTRTNRIRTNGTPGSAE
jgi:hypothetical protein